MTYEPKTFDEYDAMDTRQLGKELALLVKNRLTDSEAYRMVEAITYKRDKQNTVKKLPVPPDDITALLENPSLFEDITVQELDKKIVGEIETRKVIFLCAAGGRLVTNAQVSSYNLLVNDDAGIGKDYVVGSILEIMPKEIYIHKTRISPTAFTYWHNPQYEPDWSWDGMVFYPEDISENVLNSEVFKVMCSKGSSATIVIKQRAYEIDIHGKPVMITTTASATPNPELTRRFIIMNLDSSEEQTKAIMKRHSEFKKKGIVPDYDERYTYALSFLKRVKVRIPFAEHIDASFPTQNIVMRTNYPRFLDFISASAAFHQYQRQTDIDGYILATGADYNIARACFLKVTSNKYMIPLTINQKKILEEFERVPSLSGSVSYLHGQNMGFISLANLQANLGILVKHGILKTTVTKDQWNRDLETYELGAQYAPEQHLEIPTFEELSTINQRGIIDTFGIIGKKCLNNVENDSKDSRNIIIPIIPKTPETPITPIIPTEPKNLDHFKAHLFRAIQKSRKTGFQVGSDAQGGYPNADVLFEFGECSHEQVKGIIDHSRAIGELAETYPGWLHLTAAGIDWLASWEHEPVDIN